MGEDHTWTPFLSVKHERKRPATHSSGVREKNRTQEICFVYSSFHRPCIPHTSRLTTTKGFTRGASDAIQRWDHAYKALFWREMQEIGVREYHTPITGVCTGPKCWRLRIILETVLSRQYIIPEWLWGHGQNGASERGGIAGIATLVGTKTLLHQAPLRSEQFDIWVWHVTFNHSIHVLIIHLPNGRVGGYLWLFSQSNFSQAIFETRWCVHPLWSALWFALLLKTSQSRYLRW